MDGPAITISVIAILIVAFLAQRALGSARREAEDQPARTGRS